MIDGEIRAHVVAAALGFEDQVVALVGEVLALRPGSALLPGVGMPGAAFAGPAVAGVLAPPLGMQVQGVVVQRRKVLAISHGFHGRTAAAGAVTWKSDKWYGFPQKPFDVDFIPRDDCGAAEAMIGPDVSAVIVEPVQGVAGAFDLSAEFLLTLRESTERHGALLIADEVQSGMGRCGEYFAVQAHGIEDQSDFNP